MDKTLFKEHRVFNSGEKLYPCNMCNFKTTYPFNLRRHMKVHTDMKSFRCNKCCYSAPDMAALKTHSCNHTGDRLHKCPECLYSASKRIRLTNHMARAHADKSLHPFSSVNGHLNSDKVECSRTANPYQVSIDDINNILKGDYDLSSEPLELVQDNDVDGNTYMVTIADIQEILQGKLPAPSLNEVDGNEAAMENEDFMGQEMVNQTVFKCAVCHQLFKFEYLLKEHMSVHARKDKPYESSEYGYNTLTKNNFQGHRNMHTVRKSNMQIHSQVHTSEKSFNYPYCDDKAMQQTSANSHLNIHSEHSKCPRGADTMVALQKHMEMHDVGIHFMVAVPEEATA